MKRESKKKRGAASRGGQSGGGPSGKAEIVGKVGTAASAGLAPAKSEVEVLKILWKDGPSTVRHVHDTLTKETKSVQYTSTLKLMQVMTEKGMLARDETQMKHIYRPLLEERKTMALVLEKFLHSMYDGSISNLLVAFITNDKASKKELQKVKALLDELEKGK